MTSIVLTDRRRPSAFNAYEKGYKSQDRQAFPFGCTLRVAESHRFHNALCIRDTIG